MNAIQELFRRLSTGVYIVGAAHAGKTGAFTAAWVMQASYDPLLVVLSINPHHATYPLVKASRAFTVNVLKSEQLELAREFGTKSGYDVDKLAGVAWRPGRSGAPVLTDALAYFDCEVVSSTNAGDHEVVIARVVDGHVLEPNAKPMLYSDTGQLDGSTSLYPRWF